MDFEEYEDEEQYPDEDGFDERPMPRDSTGESVRSSACPESALDVEASADEPRRRESRRTKARGENPIFKEIRELLRGSFVSE